MKRRNFIQNWIADTLGHKADKKRAGSDPFGYPIDDKFAYQDTNDAADNLYGEVSTDTYGAGGGDFYSASGGDTDLFGSPKSKQKVLSFSWWEYAIFVVEGLLVLYVILVFAGLLPIF